MKQIGHKYLSNVYNLIRKFHLKTFFNVELFAKFLYFAMKKIDDSPILKWILNTIFTPLCKLHDKYYILKLFLDKYLMLRNALLNNLYRHHLILPKFPQECISLGMHFKKSNLNNFTSLSYNTFFGHFSQQRVLTFQLQKKRYKKMYNISTTI